METVVIAIVGGIALWIVVGIFVAVIVGRAASRAEHERAMETLHRDVRSAEHDKTHR